MIKNSKLSHDYTPILTKEENIQYKCPVSSLVSTDHYRIDIDQDACDAVVYLNIGYDDLLDYDSPIYLSATDAMELANRLMEYSIIATQNDCNANNTRIFVNDLEEKIKEKYVDWLTVYPIKLADQNEFYGCMILDIHYYILGDKNKHSARILSCNFLSNKDKLLSIELEKKLKNEFAISKVDLHIKRFTELYSELKSNNSVELSEDKLNELKLNALEMLQNNFKK